jgi:hypothetical protein
VVSIQVGLALLDVAQADEVKVCTGRGGMSDGVLLLLYVIPIQVIAAASRFVKGNYVASLRLVL